MVQAKILNWFDLEEYSLFRWLKENTPSFSLGNYGILKISDIGEVWKDRTDAQETIKKYLAEYPCLLILPQPCNGTEPSGSLHHHVHPRSPGQR
jgi:hypothetical protein